MRRQSTAPIYVSRNHLEGSFTDVPLDRILDACHKHLVTGEIRVSVADVKGLIELRAGAVDRAELGTHKGARALEQMRSLIDGDYELTQRLPDLTGELGGSSMIEGDVTGVPLIALMRHCEHHALTCTITVVSKFDRAVIEYHAGDLRRVELNGFYDDDAIVQVLDWSDARFRVSAPPLDLDIEGWPKVRRDPTLPFKIGPRFARGTSPQLPVQAAPAPSPEPVAAPVPVPAPLPKPPILKAPTPPTGFMVPSRAQVMSAIEARAPQPWAPKRTRPRQDRFELLLKTCLVIALIVAAAMLAILGF
ncbi:MAG TPA: hypothetical protein VM261_16335 [Kofleriaceae bacterium]|nr:hypothetical protein [Kofleriaceae bacterium]